MQYEKHWKIWTVKPDDIKRCLPKELKFSSSKKVFATNKPKSSIAQIIVRAVCGRIMNKTVTINFPGLDLDLWKIL